MLKLAAAVAGLAIIVSSTAVAAPIPCEEMLQEVRSVQRSTSVDDPQRALIVELIKKGLERCTADDVEHADQFFSEALKIMGK